MNLYDMTESGQPLGQLAQHINQEHRAATSAALVSIEHARRAGELLLQAKKQCGHGRWLPWLKEHCEVDARMAQKYMRLASCWDQVARANTNPDSHLTIDGALKLLKDGRQKEPTAPPPARQPADPLLLQLLPRPLALYLSRGAITPDHLGPLIGLKEAYGRDLMQRIILPDDSTEPEDGLDAEAVEHIINCCRPEDQPPVWFLRLPFSTPTPDVVVEATEAFMAGLRSRGGAVPQWEVAAFWWASQAILAPLPADGSDRDIGRAVAAWRERFESALAWWFVFGDTDEGREDPLWWDFQSDLRHSSALELGRDLGQTEWGYEVFKRGLRDQSFMPPSRVVRGEALA